MLQAYDDVLEQSFVTKDLRQYKNEPAFLESFDRMFTTYPETVRDVMNQMFVVDGSPTSPLKKTVMGAMKKLTILGAMRDLRGAMKAL